MILSLSVIISCGYSAYKHVIFILFFQVFIIGIVLQTKASSLDHNSYSLFKDNPWQAMSYSSRQDYNNNANNENYLNLQSSNNFDDTNLDTSASNTHLFSHYGKFGNDHQFGEEEFGGEDEALHIPFINSFKGEGHYSSDFSPQTTYETSKIETLGEHIDVTKPIAIPSIRHIPVGISKPFHISVPYPVLVPIPHPYPIKVPHYKPVPVSIIKELQIPFEKITPYPVIKNIPIPITKHVPYNVEKEVKVNVPHPYPVRIPVIQTVIHTSKNFGKSMGGGDFDHHHGGEYHGMDDFHSHGDDSEEIHYKPKEKKKGHDKHSWSKKNAGHVIKHKYIIRPKKIQHGHSGKHNKHSRQGFSHYNDYDGANNFVHHRPKKNERDDYYYEYI